MKLLAAALACACLACGAVTPGPADIRLGEDACAHCRMTVIAIETAAQIVAPGVEPVVFDELGCLRDYLAGKPLGPRAAVFVADHRDGRWIDARAATFTRAKASTPMGSGLLAHVDTASRDADPAAAHGAPVTADFVLHPPARRDQP